MSDIQVNKVEIAAPEEEALRQWLAEQRLKSVDNLEGAARQIITLVTALLGVLFTVLAVSKEPLPAYLQLAMLRNLGIVCVVALCLALGFALPVVLPLAYRHFPHRPDKQQELFAHLLRRKANLLIVAAVFFFVGLLALSLVLVLALIHVA